MTAAPPTAFDTMKPAVLKSVVHVSDTVHLPPTQHCGLFVAESWWPDWVTVTFSPSLALVWLRLALAMPFASNFTVVAFNVPALAPNTAVVPEAAAYGLVQGLDVSAHASSVTAVARQLTPLAGTDNSK